MQLHATARPFVKIPVVEKWVKEHTEIRWRYNFLVLVGRSMFGKTRFAPAYGIIRQKKLMQCPPALVQLGASATNAFSYKVWVHQKMIVVSTNTWFEELEEMTPGDRDWLIYNSVVVSVNSPMWVQPPTPPES